MEGRACAPATLESPDFLQLWDDRSLTVVGQHDGVTTRSVNWPQRPSIEPSTLTGWGRAAKRTGGTRANPHRSTCRLTTQRSLRGQASCLTAAKQRSGKAIHSPHAGRHGWR